MLKISLLFFLIFATFLDLIQPGNIWNSGISAIANPIDLVTSLVPLPNWKDCPTKKVVVIPSEILQAVINRSSTITDLKSKLGEPYCKKDDQFFWKIDLFGFTGFFVKIQIDQKKQEILSYEFYSAN